MSERNRPRLRARKGQIIVLMVLLIPVFVGAVGLGLDTSNLLTHRDAAQNAADLAALSATIDLPGNPTNARTNALRIATANNHHNGTGGIAVTVTTPYLGDSTQVQVQINDTVRINFMRLFGFQKVVVAAHAVATSGKPLDAIYSGGSCGGFGGVSWTATSTNITGRIHSNSTLSISTSGSTIPGPIEYVCSPGTVTSTGGSVAAPTQVGPRQSGLSITYADLQPRCTYSVSGNLTITSTSPAALWASPGHLNPNIICATGSITLNTAAQGAVTFVAGTTFNISGSGSSLSPNSNGSNILAFANGSGTSFLTGSGGTWSGIVAAPNGGLTVNSSGTFIVNGSLNAAQVTINGSGLTVNPTTLIALKPQLIE